MIKKNLFVLFKEMKLVNFDLIYLNVIECVLKVVNYDLMIDFLVILEL